MYVVLDLFILVGIIQKPTLRSLFIHNINCYFHTRFGCIRYKLDLICVFLPFLDYESMDKSEGPSKLFRISCVISHLVTGFKILKHL
jgi:hypothetical protein